MGRRPSTIEGNLRELISDPEPLIHTQHDLAVAIYGRENPSKSQMQWVNQPRTEQVLDASRRPAASVRREVHRRRQTAWRLRMSVGPVPRRHCRSYGNDPEASNLAGHSSAYSQLNGRSRGNNGGAK
jgi:hypothetical protein